MAETRIDTPRSAESRVAKTTAQAMTSVKSTLAAGDEAPAFSSLLAALDSGKVRTDTRYACPGYFDLGAARFRCWRR